ncbi:autotransporter outer membrane beta-barrel domain-containing protein [Hyphomicrobium sp. NDB2Meth4]|uniref:autotransporter outer membrane beta-barrel domain-containing protein n=1 Tax=Hyphomicrobium sp. NDB2Meth4 TaxID=1892846 RepID=UPI000930B6B1|nr:autotransporter outer membrane beta-barrel domain-containing protein [Hyphomicrobium sp. NDB2Meth4]
MDVSSSGQVWAADDGIFILGDVLDFNGLGSTTVTLTNDGKIYAGGTAINLSTGLGGGTLTVNNNNIIGEKSAGLLGDRGVLLSGAGNGAVNNAATGQINSIDDAVTIGMLGTAGVDNKGAIFSRDGSGIVTATAGTATILNDTTGSISAGSHGIFAVTDGSGADIGITNHGTVGTQATPVGGIGIIANTGVPIPLVSPAGAGTINIVNDGKVYGTTGGISATVLDTGSNGITVDNKSGSVITNGGFGILAAGLSGDIKVDGNSSSYVKSETGPGIVAVGTGNVTVDSGETHAGSGGIAVPTTSLNLSGGVIGVALGSGNATVTTHGLTSVAPGGTVGVAAISNSGAASVTLGGAIDPPLIGSMAVVLGGNMDATLNTGGFDVTADNIGLLGLNLGTGEVVIDATGSMVTQTVAGPLNVGIAGLGQGAVTIDYGTVDAKGSGVVGLSTNAGVDIDAHGDVKTAGYLGVGAFAGNGNADIDLASTTTTNTSAGGLGVIAAANKGNAIVSGAGSTVKSDGTAVTGLSVNGNVDLDTGTVTSDNSTGVFGLAINGGSVIDMHGAVQANGAFGVFSSAVDLGSGSGDSAVNLGGENVKNDGGIGVFSLALGGHSSVTGGAGGTVESLTDGIISTAVGGDSTVESGAIIAHNGSGIISTAIGGDAKATNNGEVTADNGLYGIAAFSIGGDATATANGKIDPPLIGVSSFTIGNGTATSDVNNTVQAWAVGAYAGNIGGGSVFVNVNPGGSIQSDYLGILATNIGPGDTTVNVKGAVGGYTGTATGDDAINVTNFINNGNISVTSNEDGTLNAGDDAVDITKLGGSGQINVTLGADATAADDGVTIFRTLSGVNTTDENNISVSLADGKTLTATNGNGIDISTPFANNDIAVNVGAGSSVLANNGTAVQVTGFSLLGDNNVTITNAGLVQGDGTLFDPTIRVATDGDVNINNTGTIQSDGGSTYASVIQSLAGGSNTVQNDGTITGNMQLAAVGANTVNNTSSTTWNTSGLNLYVSATGNEVNNTSTGTINAGPFTVFAMIGPTNAINNAGEFNSTGLNVYGMLGNDNSVNNSGIFNVTGFTQFLGGNFIGQNLAFNNNGGVLSMQNGTSGYGFVTPVDLGFVDYGNDIGDVVQIGVPNTTGNSFNGSGYSRYAIDTFLAAATTSASDLLIVNGDTTGVTALQVNDTNAGPGAYNPTGILVAHIEGNSDPDAFYLEGGPIDKGLFTYDLYRVQVSSFDWLLASTPDQTFFELPHLITAAQNMWHNSAGVWLDRTADLRSAATEKCAMMGSIKDSTPVCSRSVTPGAWAKVLGNTTEREQNYSWTILGKTSNFEVKSNQDGYGIVGGYDFGHETANGAWMIGAMGGYVASSLDFDGSTTDVDYRTGLVGAYATWIEGGLFIDGKVMANIGKYEYANYTNTGLSTHDKQDVLSVGGVIDTGYRMNYAGGFIEPGATLSYVEADLDNATIYGTTVNFEDGNSLRGRLGLRVGTSFVSGGHKVEPFIGASAWHEFEADNKATLSSGGYDLTAADDAGGTFGEVTGGLNVFSLGADGVSGFVKGNAQFGEDNLRGYAGSAGLRVNW